MQPDSKHQQGCCNPTFEAASQSWSCKLVHMIKAAAQQL